MEYRGASTTEFQRNENLLLAPLDMNEEIPFPILGLYATLLSQKVATRHSDALACKWQSKIL
jgi:hypothetical protein